MTDRLIPDPATAREMYGSMARLLDGRTPCWWHNTPRCHRFPCLNDALMVDAWSIRLDAAVAYWLAGDRPRGTETRRVPM